MKTIFYLFIFILVVPFTQAQQYDIEKYLVDKQGVTIAEVNTLNGYAKSYLIFVKQPLDHHHPEKGSFMQRIWLSVKDTSDAHPLVMVTEGYSANHNYISEPAYLLDANQLIVEHRYFAKSAPDTIIWKYLTVEQAATDHHHIVELFKPFFKVKWISTGVSKGGQTAIYHRAFFPDDVDVSIPYVAPINFAREDPRIYTFFHKVGNKEMRDKIHAFQKAILERRDTMMVYMKNYIKAKKWTFKMGYDKAFDIAVLEIPFSFWQWVHDINKLPDSTATNEELFSQLTYVSDFSYECDQEWKKIKPFYYQAYKELGYYSYVPGDLKPLIKGFNADTISSDIFAPGGDTLKYIPQTMQYVMTQLKENNPKIIAIAGENDPWGSTSLIVDDIPNAFKFVKPGGCHMTRIYNLPPEMKKEIAELIEKWIGVEMKSRE